MDPDKLEKLMVQVLSEVRDLRQNTVTTWALKAELQELEARLDAKIERLDAKVNQLDAKVERLDAKVERLDAKVEDLSQNVKFTQIAVLEVAGHVTRIDSKLENHATRLDRLEGAAE